MATWLASDSSEPDRPPVPRALDLAIDLAKDATYVTIGLGLLAVQRAQVQRREFERLYGQHVERLRAPDDRPNAD